MSKETEKDMVSEALEKLGITKPLNPLFLTNRPKEKSFAKKRRKRKIRYKNSS